MVAKHEGRVRALAAGNWRAGLDAGFEMVDAVLAGALPGALETSSYSGPAWTLRSSPTIDGPTPNHPSFASAPTDDVAEIPGAERGHIRAR